MKSKSKGILIAILWLAIFTSPIVYVVVTGDFPGSGKFYGIAEDNAVVTMLLAIHILFGGS